MDPVSGIGPRRRPLSRAGYVALFCCLVVSACSKAPPRPEPLDAASAAERAKRLVAELLVVDTHIDYPERHKPNWDLALGTAGNFDYPRAVAGGLDVAFLAAYVPPEDEDVGKAYWKACKRIAIVEDAIAAHPDILALARSPDDAVSNRAAGKLSLVIAIENGAPLEGRLERIAEFQERGVSYITLSHSEDNHLCDSSTDADELPRWGGLSPFGRDAVREMNRLGVMIDVAHVSDETFWQVLELSSAPVIVSHTGVRSLTPGFERNMSDEMLAAIGENGGVAQIAFASVFVNDAYRASYAASEIARVADVARAVDLAVKAAGIDHVGIGSDFDGAGYSLPRELSDVSMYANLVRELLLLGYGDGDIAKILGGNLLRVWSEVRTAAEG